MKIFSINLSDYKNTATPTFNAKRIFVDKRMIDTLLKDSLETVNKLSPAAEKRLSRDKSILEMLLQGFTRKDVARALEISIQTVNRVAEKTKAKKMYMQIRDNNILRMLSLGMPRKEVCEELGLGLTTIQSVASRQGAHKNFLSQRDSKILKMLEEGFQRATIARELGVKLHIVHEVSEKHGVFRKKINKRDFEILKMIEAGYSLQEIADALKISLSTVSRVAKKEKVLVITQPLQKKQEKVAMELFLSGSTPENVAQELGLEPKRVENIIAKIEHPVSEIYLKTMSKEIKEFQSLFRQFRNGERSTEITKKMREVLAQLQAMVEKIEI